MPLGESQRDASVDQNVTYESGSLLNGSSKSMDVNGSSTAQEFEFAPASGRIYRLQRISLFIQDPGSMDASDFGAISGSLSTGVVVSAQTSGTEYDIATLQDNMDISMSFYGRVVGGGGEGGSGFFDEDDSYYGVMDFKPEIMLDGDQGDFVKFTINDDLTDLSFFVASYYAWRVV